MTFENQHANDEHLQPADAFNIERTYETIETRRQRGPDFEDSLDPPDPEARHCFLAALKFLETAFELGTEAELDLEHLLYRLTTDLHRRLSNLTLANDELSGTIRDLTNCSDTSEVGTAILETNIDRAHRLDRRIKHLADMRDVARDFLAQVTGTEWIAPKGTAPVVSKQTAAQLSARAYLQATKARRLEQLAPDGPVFAVVGPSDFADMPLIERELNKLHGEHPDLIVNHFADKDSGFDNAVAMWCRRNRVHQIPMDRPDWNKDKQAAPYRRNDKMFELGLAGVVVFQRPEGKKPHGISLNVADKANEQRPPVPVRRIKS